MVKFAEQRASGTPKNNTLLFLRNRLSSCFLLSEPTVMYNICKCLQDPKGMLKLLKTDLDRERFLNHSLK